MYNNKRRNWSTTTTTWTCIKHLLKRASPRVPPPPQYLPISVQVKLRPLAVRNVCPKTYSVEMPTLEMYNWTDPRLTWNASDFGGVQLIDISPRDIWMPDIAVWQSPGSTLMQTRPKEYNAVVTSDGNVLYIPVSELSISCDAQPWKRHNKAHDMSKNNCTSSSGQQLSQAKVNSLIQLLATSSSSSSSSQQQQPQQLGGGADFQQSSSQPGGRPFSEGQLFGGTSQHQGAPAGFSSSAQQGDEQQRQGPRREFEERAGAVKRKPSAEVPVKKSVSVILLPRPLPHAITPVDKKKPAVGAAVAANAPVKRPKREIVEIPVSKLTSVCLCASSYVPKANLAGCECPPGKTVQFNGMCE